jgi:hypothetical protein
MDVSAAAASMDAVEFRLRHLMDEWAMAVIEVAGVRERQLPLQLAQNP